MATEFTVKLLINRSTNTVLFAEASKEVVDFLFSFLEMPLASVIKLLTTEQMIGSIGNLYQSVSAMNSAYLQSKNVKNNLLSPVVRSSASCERLLLPASISSYSSASSKTTTGYVKEVVTYSILDDLTVTPMSTISGITILNKFNVKDVGVLEEKMAKLGYDQGLDLLKASLQSKSVLTNVFLSPKTFKNCSVFPPPKSSMKPNKL